MSNKMNDNRKEKYSVACVEKIGEPVDETNNLESIGWYINSQLMCILLSIRPL